jgi:hypothetical protein
MAPRRCDCDACVALLAECGEEHFALYRKKLLKPRWAGSKSAAERAYIRAHRLRSEAQVATAKAHLWGSVRGAEGLKQGRR